LQQNAHIKQNHLTESHTVVFHTINLTLLHPVCTHQWLVIIYKNLPLKAE